MGTTSKDHLGRQPVEIITGGSVQCFECGAWHEAEYSHDGRFGEGPIYAVTCTDGLLTSYYTSEVVHIRPTVRRTRANSWAKKS